MLSSFTKKKNGHSGDGGFLRSSVVEQQEEQAEGQEEEPSFSSLESPPMTMRKRVQLGKGFGYNNVIMVSPPFHLEEQSKVDQEKSEDAMMPVASLFGGMPRRSSSIGKNSLLARRGNPYVSSIQSIASTATSVDLTEDDQNIDDMMEDDDTLIPSDNDNDDELLFHESSKKKRPADIHPAGKEETNLTPPSSRAPPTFLRLNNFDFDTWRNNNNNNNNNPHTHRNNSCLETIKSFDSQSSTTSTSGSSANSEAYIYTDDATNNKLLIEEDPRLKEETTEICTGAKVRKLNLDDHPYNATNDTDNDNPNNCTSNSQARTSKRLDFASSRNNNNNLSKHQTPLIIDCQQNKYDYDKNNYNNNKCETISPTDIFDFPQMKSTPPRPTIYTPNQNYTHPQSSPSRTITNHYIHQSHNHDKIPPQTPAVRRKINRRIPMQDFSSGLTSNTAKTQQNNYNMITAVPSVLERPTNKRTSFLSSPQKTKTNSTHNQNDYTNDTNTHSTAALVHHQQSRFTSDFEILSVIGDGCFGTVYKCKSKLDGCKYAIKATKRSARGPLDRDRMLKEVYALAAICDQADTATFHIVRYHQAWMDHDQKLYIQTELCTSTLKHEMQKNKFVHNIPRRYKLLREMLLALQFIHKNKMVHLDIKPDNIFIKDGKFKLGDFGLASKQAKGNLDDDIQEGDSRYMSMDLLREDHHDLTKSDMFSLGATMYEICINRDLPCDGQEWQDIRAGKLATMENTNSPNELVSIIKSMMDPRPDLRPTASELLKKKPLLSEEEKLLIMEKNKVLEAKLALAAQQIKFKKLTPPRKILLRSNTWNGHF